MKITDIQLTRTKQLTRRNVLIAGSAAGLGFFLDGGTAFARKTKLKQRFIYRGGSLVLTPDSVRDSQRTLHLEDVLDVHPEAKWQLRDATPLTKRLFNCALNSFVQNVYRQDPRGDYLTAGTHWGPRKYTRDVSYSGILGANDLYPSLMLSSLKNFTKTREELGFRVPKGYDATSPELSKVNWIIEPISILEYLEKYHTDPYTHRTDDVVWIWCCHDLFRRNPGIADWNWLYEAGARQFSGTYDLFFDHDDGLYRGQLTFVDATGSGYAPKSTFADCVLVKATATNCLYYLAMLGMAEASEKTGRKDEATQWLHRAESLKRAILQSLRLPNGYLSCYRDRSGTLRPERDAMGTALVVIAGIVKGKAALQAMADYPRDERGVPLFEPFLPWGDPKGQYHNHSSWPFASTFFIKAMEIAESGDYTDYNAAMLARFVTPLKSGEPATFREYCFWADGVPRGSADQLWTAASFIDVCRRAKLLQTSSD